MTEAIITDINEYRKSKEGSVLSKWSDTKLKTRYALLKQIEDGANYLTDSSHPLVVRAFPNGFDPENHPEENIGLVREEAVHRGVTLT